MKLKISSDLSYFSNKLPQEPILYPFSKFSAIDNHIFEKYIKSSSDIFELTSLEDTDIVVVPSNWEALLRLGQVEQQIQLVQRAKKTGKATVSFFGGDCSHSKLPIETDIVFRQSLYDFSRNSNDFAFPAWSEDLLKKYVGKDLVIRKKSAKPTVGFCGFVNRTKFKPYIKYHLIKSSNAAKGCIGIKSIPPLSSDHILRAKAISNLSKNLNITHNFIQRDNSFFGKNNQVKKQRLEFVGNLLDSDYILCPRGSGNYSFRFYEALSCGRILIFLNTQCVLPYNFEINWQNHCIWIEEDSPHIGKKVLEFHEKLSLSEFIEIQYACRQLWEKYIEPSSFFSKIYRHLDIVKAS